MAPGVESRKLNKKFKVPSKTLELGKIDSSPHLKSVIPSRHSNMKQVRKYGKLNKLEMRLS